MADGIVLYFYDYNKSDADNLILEARLCILSLILHETYMVMVVGC